MKAILAAMIGAFVMTASPVRAAPTMHTDPVIREDAAQKLSDHVYMIEGFPNIAIIVGSGGVLVVDTGLGPKAGAVVAREAAKLAPGRKMYLTTTHFHPEHAGGEAGFPPDTVIIRPKVQQEELDAGFQAIVDAYFKKAFPTWIEGITFRKPDVLFDKEHDVDLGGVHVKLLWAGPAHTRGDEIVFVVEDRVAVTGDVVQNKMGPYFTADTTPGAWAKTVAAVAKLHPKLVVPDHSPPGGAEVIAAQHAFLTALDQRAHALKKQGVKAEDAGKRINTELAARFPDWTIPDQTPGVVAAYGR
jgi:glyoxylase-like metal-dependent hydrolase (beta-lactamase superfamily II)